MDLLLQEGLLTEAEISAADFGDDEQAVDYGKLYKNRLPLLRKAFSRFNPDADFKDFCKSNAYWLDNYALFMALKNAHDDLSWEHWERELRFRRPDAIKKAEADYAETIEFYRFQQYIFSTQWQALKQYANKNGIKIIGDIPIYVAYDSADVWAEPSQFLLDAELKPIKVAGCPPDAFSEEGQLWGNPLYRWDVMKRDGYAWWKRRMSFALKLYDVIRIDHFRGFESYYAIPYGEKTAKNGKWLKGPGMALFKSLKEEFGEMPIIAEDLGFLTPAVLKMLKQSGYPGMKVLQFAFDTREDSDYLPHNYNSNCVVYTGTHDNDTVIGWTKSAEQTDIEVARRYMHVDEAEGFNWAMMRTALSSVADTCILMMPDLMGLGSDARINTPSTIGGNWLWRIRNGCINDWLAGILYENTKLYGRTPKE